MIESVLFTISLFLVYVSVSLLLQPPPPLFLVFPLFSLALFEVLACVRLLLPSRMERVFCCFYCVSLCAARVHLFFPFSGRPKGSRVRPVARPRSRRRGPRGFHPSFSPATGGAVHGCDLPSGVRGKLEMGPSFVLA